MTNTHMKAIVYKEYGSPDVLQLQEVEKPTPKEDEVLVRVHASSINFGDRALVRGEPFLIRLMGYGLLKPKHAIPCGDLAGRVAAVGGNVKHFQPGDDVFGDISTCGFGAFAEYVAVPESVLAPKPTNVTFGEAASVCQAAVVALQGLRDRGRIRSGQKVLINGASGGVGTFAVQIAKSFGAEVTGVCSTPNVDLVRSIGADHVIDYTETDFTKNGQRYDLIFDIVANHPASAYSRALNPKGAYVACAFSPSALLLGPIISLIEGKRFMSLVHKLNPQDLITMKELLEAGKVVPVIDRSYPLAEAAEAMRYCDQGNPRGKVVVTMMGED